MYGKEILLEEEKFLYTVQILIRSYKRDPIVNRTVNSTVTKEGVINKIKAIGKSLWIDEELIQDQINKL